MSDNDLMHWVTVDGFPMPVRIGGHPALDFCNTWAGWGEPPHPDREWLADFDRLAVWSAHAELLDADTVQRLRRDAGRRPEAAARVLSSARRLRTLLHTAVLDPENDRSLAQVGAYARAAMQALMLRPGPEGRPHWDFREPSLAQPVHAAARAGAELLTGPDLSLVKACPGNDCGWLFIDRRGRRRWCSMSSCGNRAKVRAHAARQRA